MMEEQNKLFDEVMSMISSEGNGEQLFKDYILPLLEKIDEDTLLSHSASILNKAGDNSHFRTIEYLMKRTDKWPKDVVLSCLDKAARRGRQNTFKAFLNDGENVDATLFNKWHSIGDSDIRRVLNDYKDNLIGKNWTVTEDYEIVRETENKAIQDRFNFGASYVRTVVYNNGLREVRERDFKDFQTDSEIRTAYGKLCKFSDNPPKYNSKDQRSHRVIPNKHTV